MAKSDKRKIVGLVCDACGGRHYYTVKSTQNTPDKINLRKYCPVTRKYAPQAETKVNLGRNEVKPRKH